MMNKELLLVGSIPGDFSEDALRLGAQIGDLVPGIPDGETGDRSRWVVFQAFRVFDGHPQIDTLLRPKPGPGKPDWVPAAFPEGLKEFWTFKIQDGVEQVKFPNLLYATHAQRSYETFLRLRKEGVIPEGTRFQVSLPLPESGYSWFFHEPADLQALSQPYEEAMIREVAEIVDRIPNDDLAIQWDVCYEVLDIEGAFPWALPGDPFQRYADVVTRVSPDIPESVLLGYHFCWGDLGHEHLKQPKDLELAVAMSNAAVARSGRRVDWVHVPVPIDRTDNAYFEPLKGLELGDTRIYMGLIHYRDGLEGAKRRIETAQQYLDRFGLATECGFGRRDPATVPALFELHRQIIDECAEVVS